jgi:hypothetical protein
MRALTIRILYDDADIRPGYSRRERLLNGAEASVGCALLAVLRRMTIENISIEDAGASDQPRERDIPRIRSLPRRRTRFLGA